MGIAEVQVAAWHAAYRGIVPDPVLANFTVPRRTTRWQRILTSPLPGGLTFVAERSGRLLGFASVVRARDLPQRWGELAALYVHPDAWGTGLGHALHEVAVEHLAGQAYPQAVLYVLADNARARRFYEAHGWAADGTVKMEDFGEVELAEPRYSRPLAG